MSSGFQPRGFDALPKEIYHALFYSSTSADAHRSIAKQAGSSIVANCRGTSCQDIHDQSRRKYVQPEAPFIQRSACEYTRQYVERPLDGIEVNKQIHDLSKEKSETASQKAPGRLVKLCGISETKAAFIPASRDQLANAAGSPAKPEQRTHFDPTAKSMEFMSEQQSSLSKPNAELAAKSRGVSCKPARGNLGGLRRNRSEPVYMPVSTNEHDYRASLYKEHWPAEANYRNR